MKTCFAMYSLALTLAVCCPVAAEDWPTYRHDNRRSGVTAEAISPGALEEAWVYRAPAPPQPAWHGPAKWDAYAGIENLRSMRDYDPVFYTVAVDGTLYFGSSVEDAVIALDTAGGKERWRFSVGGPVRIAPAWHGGRLYFGADDGYARCISDDGAQTVWQYKPAKQDRLLPSNGKLISLYPVRTGVLVDAATAYFGAAMLPWHDAYLCAVDADTGRPEGDGLFSHTMQGMTLEGAMLASPNKLYVLQGRAAPLVFSRETGRALGRVEGSGGVFALLTPENQLVMGPDSQKEKYVAITDTDKKDKIASFDRGNFLIVQGPRAYVLREGVLLAFERASGGQTWERACDAPYTLVMSEGVLWVGGNDTVLAIDPETGEDLARLPVSGRAYGITIANGALYASTDLGAIHCFR